MTFLKRYSKAIISGLSALVTAYLATRADGVTQNEFIGIVVAVLGATGLTAGVPFNLGVGSVDGAGVKQFVAQPPPDDTRTL